MRDAHVDLVIRREEPPGSYRLSQGVLEIEADGRPVLTVTCGAGLGGDWVCLRYQPGSEEGAYIGEFSLREVARDWLKALEGEGAPVPGRLLSMLERPS
jgi:hypothetical protein